MGDTRTPLGRRITPCTASTCLSLARVHCAIRPLLFSSRRVGHSLGVAFCGKREPHPSSLSSEYGTDRTVKARFWSCLSVKVLTTGRCALAHRTGLSTQRMRVVYRRSSDMDPPRHRNGLMRSSNHGHFNTWLIIAVYLPAKFTTRLTQIEKSEAWNAKPVVSQVPHVDMGRGGRF